MVAVCGGDGPCFDHLRIPVTDLTRSRRRYVDTLGLTVEWEVPDRQTVALKDSSGFTIFLQEVADPVGPNGAALWFQDARCRRHLRRVAGARRCLRACAPQIILGLRGRAERPRRVPRSPVG